MVHLHSVHWPYSLVVRKDDFTTSTRKDTSYALLNIVGNVRVIIEIPGYS